MVTSAIVKKSERNQSLSEGLIPAGTGQRGRVVVISYSVPEVEGALKCSNIDSRHLLEFLGRFKV